MRLLLIPIVAMTACAPEPLAKLPAGTVVTRNVAYGRHAKQVLDIYQPLGTTVKLRPALFFIHGGGWTGMSKEDVIEDHCRPYVERGFVVVNVEYRLAADALAPAAVQDVRAAGRWLLANAARLGVDTKRIVVSGNSVGGHLAMMTVLPMDESRYGTGLKAAAIVNIHGVMDVGDLLAGANQRDFAVAWLKGLTDTGLSAELSPLQHLSADLPPVLTVHGDADEVVPYAQALRLSQALKALGVRTELITVAGGRHDISPAKWKELYPRIFEFLDTCPQLKL